MLFRDIPWRPEARTLRQFAGIWLVWFAGLALAVWFLRGDAETAIILSCLAITIGPVGLAHPAAIRGVYVSSMVVTYPIGFVISCLLLAAIFYCVFTPVGLLFRLIGRDVMERRFEPQRDTYWTPKTAAPDTRSYFHQS